MAFIVQKDLGKRTNKKAMTMLERAEQEYKDLIRKRKIVLTDKQKIEAVICELDNKKNDTLERTYRKVNKNFGTIFSKLLPGTSAKLEPPESEDGENRACSILDGLQIKVGFGNDWKATLQELALSLILSLLVFKPAH